ncbi:MAG: hypothetical protein OXH15_06635 [Gammaproteobacteria bacterium]|nr:hypothetical protein [Gammaproteobacteria bacterium]
MRPEIPRAGCAARRRSWTASLAIGTLLAWQGAAGAEVVFGSFAGWDAADEFRDRVERDLDLEAEIVEVRVGDKRYLRVLAAGLETEAGARSLIAKARREGYRDAWYVGDPVARSPERNEGGLLDETRGATPAVDTPRQFARPPGEPPTPRSAPALKLALTPDGSETITVPRYDAADIRLDGRLDEALWEEVAGYDNMALVDPGTLAKPRHKTITRYLHTADGLYIGVWNEQPRRTLAARADARDGFDHDAWGITLDTSGDGRHGLWFNIALGTTAVAAGAGDNGRSAWRYATAASGNGWALEAFLPWSMLSLPSAEKDRVVGMYVNRKVAYLNERWGWPASVAPKRDAAMR